MSRPGATALFFLILSASVCSAEEAIPTDPEKPFLYRFVVTPLRSLKELVRLPQDVTVVEGRRLRVLPARDPSEALARSSGIDITSRTGFGHLTPLSIRGSESRHVSVMVDGIPFNTQASGQADVLPLLPMEPLDRIELLKGPASHAWGSSLGGVVHLITKDVPKRQGMHGRSTSAWAEFRSFRESLELSGRTAGFGYLFTGEYAEAAGARIRGGRPNREDTLHKRFFGKIEHELTDVMGATLTLGYSGADLNEGVYATSNTWTHVPYHARYGQLRLGSDPQERRHWEAAFKVNRQVIASDTMNGTTDRLASSTRTQDHYYGTEIKAVIGLREEDELVAGHDLSMHVLKSSQMDASRDIVQQAPYASYSLALDPVTWTGALRYDWNEEFGDELAPSLGLVYETPLPETVVRANVSRAFHAPPLLWKYFEDVTPGVTANNPDIKAERAWVYEAGLETELRKGLWSKLTAHYSDIEDAIAVALNGQGLFSRQNVQAARVYGLEWENRLRLASYWEISFAAAYNDAKNLTTDADFRGRGVARPKFRLGMLFDHPELLTAHLLGRYDRWDSPASAAANDRKFIFDLRLSKTMHHDDRLDASLFLNVYNLTNSKYWSSINFPLPERHFEGGITLEF